MGDKPRSFDEDGVRELGEKVRARKANGKSPPMLVIKSAADIEHADFPPVRYVQYPILPTGVCLLAGKPKMGKSWLALQIGIATALGQVALNIEPQLRSYGVPAGDVLYRALEDNDRRMKSRILKQSAGFPPRFHYTTQAPKGADCAAAIAEWLAAAESPRLVIVDTLQKIADSQYNPPFHQSAPVSGGDEIIASSAGVRVARSLSTDADTAKVVSLTPSWHPH